MLKTLKTSNKGRQYRENMISQFRIGLKIEDIKRIAETI